MPERCFLLSMRRCLDARVGLVARRGVGLTAASWINATSRACASARLRSWVRWLCAMITSTPSLVMRRPPSFISRNATSFGNDGDCRTSNRSCTAVDSLLTFCPPGPDERTKLSSSSDSSMLIWSVMRIMTVTYWSMISTVRQILLRQHLAFFHRRLIERIDAKQMRGDDRLQHEVHQEFAQMLLVHAFEMDGAHRAAVLGERFGSGAALRRDEIADRLAGKIRLAGQLAEVGRHARAPARRRRGDDGEELVARAGDVELKLAVLVNGAEGADRRGAFAIFAEALGPELHIPFGEHLQPVGVSHHH